MSMCNLLLLSAVMLAGCEASLHYESLPVLPALPAASVQTAPAVELSPSPVTPAGAAYTPRPLPVAPALPPEPLPPASDASPVAEAELTVAFTAFEQGETRGLSLDLAPVEILPDVTESVQQSLANGLSKYTVLFFVDDSAASKAAYAQAAWLAKSRWPLVCVPITHDLATEYGVNAAPQFVALYGGVEVGCSDGANRADIYRMISTAYAPQYAALRPAGWTVDSLKAWLESYAENPNRKPCGVSGSTVFDHLTDPSHPHRYDAELVRQLTPREQALLHDADHDGLASPAGPVADAMSKPTARKAAAKNLPTLKTPTSRPRTTQPYCPNCVRPQMRW